MPHFKLNHVFHSLAMLLGFFGMCRHMFVADAAVNMFPDNELFLGPFLGAINRNLLNVEWPYQIGEILGGVAFSSNPQVTTFYPFYFTFLPIWTDPIQSIRSLHFITLFHVFIFQVNSYILLKNLRVTFSGALVGTLLIVFNFTTWEVMKWAHLIASYAWVPLYLAGVFRVLGGCRDSLGLTYIVVGLTMMVSAMIGQPMVLSAFFTASLLFFWILRMLWRDVSTNSMSLLVVLYSVAVAFLILSVCILPFVLLLPGLIRWIASDYAIVGNSPIPWKYFLQDSIFIDDIYKFFVLTPNHYAIANPFIGVGPLVVAALAVILCWSDWRVQAVAFVALYSFLSSFGETLGFAQINYVIPLLNKIREPSYFLLPLNISVGILCAFAISRLEEISKSKVKGLAIGIFILIGVTFSLSFKDDYSKLLIQLKNIPIYYFFIWCLIILTAISTKMRPTIYITTLIVLNQLWWVQWEPSSIDKSDYVSKNMRALEPVFERLAKLDPQRDYRLAFGGDLDGQAAAMLGTYYRLRSLNSYLNPLPVNQFDEMYRHGPGEREYFRGLGVKYLVCLHCAPNETIGFEFLEAVGSYSIYSSKHAFPRIYIGRSDLQDLYMSSQFQVRSYQQALLRRGIYGVFAPYLGEIDATTSSACIVESYASSYNTVSAGVRCDIDAIVILNEFNSGNWYATINDIEADVFVVNGNQVGIRVGPGVSSVQFLYQPAYVQTGALFSLLGVALFLLSLWYGYQIDKRDKSAA